MDKQTAFEKLKAMANEPKDSLKKFLAKEILTHNEPLDFFSLAEKFGMGPFIIMKIMTRT